MRSWLRLRRKWNKDRIMSETKLQSIRMQNFKKHEELTIDFSDALTVIRGPNYSGKSTVLEAVFFALFGTKAVPGGAEIITRSGSKSKAVVTLSLRMADADYHVVRTPSAASLLRLDDEITVATGHTAVNEEIAKLIGGDMKRTMMLAFSTQGETSALLTMGATKLNSIIEDVSGVDYVDKLIEFAIKRVAVADTVLESLGEVEDEEELQEAFDKAAITLDRSLEHEKKLESKLIESRSELKKVKEALDELERENKKAELNNRK